MMTGKYPVFCLATMKTFAPYFTKHVKKLQSTSHLTIFSGLINSVSITCFPIMINCETQVRRKIA